MNQYTHWNIITHNHNCGPQWLHVFVKNCDLKMYTKKMYDVGDVNAIFNFSISNYSFGTSEKYIQVCYLSASEMRRKEKNIFVWHE